MFNFLKKNNKLEIKAPIIGTGRPLSDVPDEVFASKMMGDGIAFEPSEGILYAPMDGEIVQVFPTLHAVGIKSNNGLEILLHIGIDTVNLSGEGFESFVNAGDKVTAGQKLISFDINLIKEKAKSVITPLIITNMDEVANIEHHYGATTEDSVVLTITLN
ncbi:PTS sugar transporter subunit IIA [Lederbergia lenta]|uniref:PTS system, glucose subfamily, IIA subunit n=1 Tax=Lederbergia lenta TaxID=1467 RepID=A0A2X4WWG8_LEDLE|nr:PTS glucose transporter subunit IIA [Lederbergia lenta]MCM3111766.1 PTS glucose transporter subunit IIA [Lederbergia lenta]MEC2322920.1 PTS glucose transporter subunit IIA [Lederbergia lenta]SQI62040.1 PTS system, glucose subfamily, IIA subunit [Lederbergia lenta]